MPPVDEQQGESAVELFEFDVINESYVGSKEVVKLWSMKHN